MAIASRGREAMTEEKLAGCTRSHRRQKHRATSAFLRFIARFAAVKAPNEKAAPRRPFRYSLSTKLWPLVAATVDLIFGVPRYAAAFSLSATRRGLLKRTPRSLRKAARPSERPTTFSRA